MMISYLVIAGATWVGFNIGANDGANCVGACIGGGALGFRKAVLLGAAFAFVGGLFGTKVTATISQDVLLPSDLTPMAAAACLFAAGSVVALATTFGMPVSTSHATVLAMVGVGLGTKAHIEMANLAKIVSSWVILPVAMIGLSFLIITVLKSLLSRVSSLVNLEIILKYMLIASSMYASFALGASHAGLAGGMVEGAEILGRFGATLLGSFCIAAGVLFFGGRVIRTLAEGITPLSPVSAFAMQLSAAVGLNVCSILGLPVSSSQAIVAAAVGVGLAQRGTAVNSRQIAKIVVFWIVIPIGTFLATYLFFQFIGHHG